MDPTVTVIGTAIKALFIYFNLSLSVKLDSFSCSVTSMSFLNDCPSDFVFHAVWNWKTFLRAYKVYTLALYSCGRIVCYISKNMYIDYLISQATFNYTKLSTFHSYESPVVVFCLYL